jgi:hypothetical protein
MKTVNTLQFKIYLIVFNLMSIAAMADDPDFPFEGDPGDEPAAPIDDWIFPMVLLGIVMIVYYSKKKQPTKV